MERINNTIEEIIDEADGLLRRIEFMHENNTGKCEIFIKNDILTISIESKKLKWFITRRNKRLKYIYTCWIIVGFLAGVVIGIFL